MDELETVADTVREMGRQCACFTLDVTQVDSIRHFIDQTLATYERVDVLVNNAGYNKIQPALDYTEEEFDYIIDANLKNVIFCSTIMARHWIERKQPGKIINISSQAGMVGAPLRTPYSGAKGGVCNMTKSMAAEWAPHHINVNAVAPTLGARGASRG